VHVYGDGKLCLDLIDAKVFRADVSFVAIAEAIYNVIHAPPNPLSPANLTMNEYYQHDKAKYEAILLEQAKLLTQPWRSYIFLVSLYIYWIVMIHND